MDQWLLNQSFQYITVETETYQNKAVANSGYKGTKGTSRIDLLIIENGTGNNPNPRYIIGDIKTGGDCLGAKQMAKSQTNAATGAQPVSGSGKNAKYPQQNVANVQHVQFKPQPFLPQGMAHIGPRFEFGNPQSRRVRTPGTTERCF